MTIHYHGTPIGPIRELLTLRGRHFCVSHAAPANVTRVHKIGQSVMLDNGAFSKWKKGKETDWLAYYAWCDEWLDYPTTWAVIPDVIEANEEVQDDLLRQWPFKYRGAPVWHMHEDINRLLTLLDTWPRVCIGSSKEYAIVLSPEWSRRMDQCWNSIIKRHTRLPWIHMLRGMQLVDHRWPFASLDSTDIAQSHHREHNSALKLADRWDGKQCPASWKRRPEQLLLTDFLLQLTVK